MKKKNIKNKIKGKGEMNMSLYEINQGIIGSLPAYDENQLDELKDNITEWEVDFENNNYFMLLCTDINYYTVFCLDEKLAIDFYSLGDAVVDVLIEANYTIHSEEILDNDHCEIWVKNDQGETYAFMLFPYDQGVVYYGY